MSSPQRDIPRVTSRIGRYTSGESAGNVETVLEKSPSYDDGGNDKPQQHEQPYGLRRIFSNPAANSRKSSSTTMTSLLHNDIEEVVHITESDSTKNNPYALRRIFSNPKSPPTIESGVPLNRTKSYAHPPSMSTDRSISLVRRVSRLKGYDKKNDDAAADDATLDESLDSNSYGGSSSNKLQSVKRSKKKWALLFTVLGLTGVGGYMGYTALTDKKGVNESVQTSSLESFDGSLTQDMFVDVQEDDQNNATLQDATTTSEADSLQLQSTEDVSATESPTYSPTFKPSGSPVVNPIAPLVEQKAKEPAVTVPPTGNPIQSQTSSPSKKPTSRPTKNPTSRPTEDTTITFYVMADAPYTDYERDEVMPDVIGNLPDDAELLFHLGDLEYYKEDNCEEWAYAAASRALRRSRVPVFVLPGDNDINDCDDINEAESHWMDYFGYMDENWNHTIPLERWGELDESFSFVRNRILFFGINIVGGTPYSNSEKSARHGEHLHMLKSIMNNQRSDYDVVVLLGHAEPKTRHHGDLFEGADGLAAFVKDMKKPFLHIHGDYHWWYEDEGSFGVDNYLRISLDSLIREDKQVAVPVRVEIDSSKRYGAIKIDRGRSGWDAECCSGSGWPRKPDDDDYYYNSTDR